MSSVAKVHATNVSSVVVGLTIRDSFMKGWRVGSEKSFIAHGVDWKWDFILSEGSWDVNRLETEDIFAIFSDGCSLEKHLKLDVERPTASAQG